MFSLVTCLSCLACFVVTANSLHCFEGWHNNSDTCYGYSDTALPWLEAAKVCSLFNGHLAQIETAAENEFIKTFLKYKQAQRVWIGATDIFSEGNWEWFQSRQYLFPFSDWYTGKPANAGGAADCLYMFSSYNYQWADDPCVASYTFLCETKYRLDG